MIQRFEMLKTPWAAVWYPFTSAGSWIQVVWQHSITWPSLSSPPISAFAISTTSPTLPSGRQTKVYCFHSSQYPWNIYYYFPLCEQAMMLNYSDSIPTIWHFHAVLWEFTAPRSKSGFSRCLLFYVLPFDECFLSLATTIIPKALPISTSAEPGSFFFQAEPVVGNKQLLLICHWFSKLRVPLPWELFSAFESKHSNPWQALLGCHSIFGTSECHRWHHITSSTIRQETCLQNLAFPYTFPKLFTLKKSKSLFLSTFYTSFSVKTSMENTMIKRLFSLYIPSHTAYFVFLLMTLKPRWNNPSCLSALQC